ncbi:formylglycine-generating enzyme family protein [Verrucomicrobiota bacterium]
MSKMFACALIVLLLAGSVLAWVPSEWVWFTWPFAYSFNEGGWYYMNQGDQMWCLRLDAGQWYVLGLTECGLSNGWSFYYWPFAYSWDHGAWYYLNEADEQWCVHLATGAWSQFGQGMATTTASTTTTAVSPTSSTTSTSTTTTATTSAATTTAATTTTVVTTGGSTTGPTTSTTSTTTTTSVATTTAATTTAYMVLIPAGSFQMGNCMDPDEGSGNELPVHAVYVSAFYMDRYEVTKTKWDEVASWADDHGYDIGPSDGAGKADNHPVQDVTWYECVKWCNARSQKEGLGACYTVDESVYRTGESTADCNWNARGYRLPTEAEWEKAARGGLSGQRFPWGANINHDYANYRANGSAWDYDTSPYTSYTYHPDYDEGVYPYTSPVGSFAPNGYGLYDMAGNAWERCWDRYEYSYYGSSPGSDPRGPTSGSFRVIRGGCWVYSAERCRVAHRIYGYQGGSDYNVGFRAVLPAQ